MTTTAIPALHGLVEMTNEEYHAAPGISKSGLDKVAKSPRHYWARYVDPNRGLEKSTPAMVLGTATHVAVLETEQFAVRYVAAPECDKRTKEGKAIFEKFNAEAGDRIVLTADEYALALRLSEAVQAHPIASGLLRNGEAEQTYFATDRDTGALIKCRPDWLTEGGWLVDLKTTDDASPSGFGRSAANFRYDVQAAWYSDVLEQLYGKAPEHFIFIAVEKSAPYAIGVYYITPEQIATARDKMQRDLARIVACQASGVWPDYGEEPMALRLPNWANLVEA